MKEVTEQGAYLQLAQLCARSEHCQHDLTEKMRRWGMSDEAQTRVMERLVTERYVDDERYARAFVHDKIRYNKWGRRKVEQALWQKRVDDDIRQRVLDEVDDEEYLSVLRPLLKQKRREYGGTKVRRYGDTGVREYEGTKVREHEVNQKLVRFALSRGFTYDIIRQCLDVSEEDIDETEI